MNVIVWGLGYVGTVSAACLANDGHNVIGIDINSLKVNTINDGKTPIREKYLDNIIKLATSTGQLRAQVNANKNLDDFDFSLICVGTPSAGDGSTDLNYITTVAKNIGQLIANFQNYHIVALRSTAPPRTTRDVLLPILEKYSKKTCGVDFGLVMNPEFLREGNAVNDFKEPPYTVIGSFDQKSGSHFEKLYSKISAPTYHVTLEEAESLKLVNNAFHSLKIGFANEISRFSNIFNIDSNKIMKLVCADTKLNISPAYLKPGYAFGGSCLPKDLRSINYLSKTNEVKVPILNSILESNKAHIDSMISKISQYCLKNITVIGLTFKSGTDDVRESPSIPLIKALIKHGLDIRVFDDELDLTSVVGANREYLYSQIGNIDSIIFNNLLLSIRDVQGVVFTKMNNDYFDPISNYGKTLHIFDVLGIADHGKFGSQHIFVKLV
jgi:GDP-mannose 6-dehydrogenase